MAAFGLFNKLTASKGKHTYLHDIMLRVAKEMEQLDDCQLYDVNVNEDDKDAIFIYEAWDDEQAHQASLTLDVFQSLIKEASSFISKMEKIYVFT